MSTFAEKIIERKLQPCNVFIASFIAGLNELGAINQASVNIAARRAGRYLAEYAKAQGNLPEPGGSTAETAMRYISLLNDMLGLSTMFNTESDGGKITVRITSSGCRFCPKGIGEAELEGTLCPYPALIEEFINELLPEGAKIHLVIKDRRPMIKDKTSCLIELS